MDILYPIYRCVTMLLLLGAAVHADTGLVDYIPTQPDMRWAYHIEAGSTWQVVRVTLPGYQVVPAGSEAEVVLSGPSGWTRPGEPRLPVLPVVFEVADGMVVTIDVDEGDPVVQSVGRLRPRDRMESIPVDGLTDQEVTVAEPSPEIYGQSAWWPDKLVDQREAKGRGRRFIRLGVIPFRYHPEEGNLAFYSNLTVLVTFTQKESVP